MLTPYRLNSHSPKMGPSVERWSPAPSIESAVPPVKQTASHVGVVGVLRGRRRRGRFVRCGKACRHRPARQSDAPDENSMALGSCSLSSDAMSEVNLRLTAGLSVLSYSRSACSLVSYPKCLDHHQGIEGQHPAGPKGEKPWATK